MEKGNKHIEQLWKVWKDGYLLNLRERNQPFQKRPLIQAKKCQKIGDIYQSKIRYHEKLREMNVLGELVAVMVKKEQPE